MNGKKNVNFYYYKPCLENDSTTTVQFESYLEKINSEYNKKVLIRIIFPILSLIK